MGLEAPGEQSTCRPHPVPPSKPPHCPASENMDGRTGMQVGLGSFAPRTEEPVGPEGGGRWWAHTGPWGGWVRSTSSATGLLRDRDGLTEGQGFPRGLR